MDLKSADAKFHLRLNDLLNASDFDFIHDYCGIRNNIVRDKFPSQNFGLFIPRFAGIQLEGVVTLDVRYEFDLGNNADFDDCTNINDVFHTIFESENGIDNLCTRNEYHALYYEGFEISDEVFTKFKK